MTQDFSRSAFDVHKPKHWSSVQAQQGRLLTDDDVNEADGITKEDIRRTRADVIGTSGSPDDGFMITNPRVNASQIDFDLSPGTIYSPTRTTSACASRRATTRRRRPSYYATSMCRCTGADEAVGCGGSAWRTCCSSTGA